jgi:holo-[acyl-carrier protein] synthase
MIGIDAVDIEHLRGVMERSEGTERRLFTSGERTYCHSRVDPVTHFAGTLAAKEAVIKAARLGPLLAWGRRIEVRRDDSGAPRVTITGIPFRRFAISISHDGPVAVAVAVARGSTTAPLRSSPVRSSGPLKPKPNEQLLSYIRGPLAAPESRVHDASQSVLGTDFP